MCVVFEGVSFDVEKVRCLSKKEFVELCLNVHFTDRKLSDRKKMLGDIFDIINESDSETETTDA